MTLRISPSRNGRSPAARREYKNIRDVWAVVVALQANGGGAKVECVVLWALVGVQTRAVAVSSLVSSCFRAIENNERFTSGISKESVVQGIGGLR